MKLNSTLVEGVLVGSTLTFRWKAQPQKGRVPSGDIVVSNMTPDECTELQRRNAIAPERRGAVKSVSGYCREMSEKYAYV